MTYYVVAHFHYVLSMGAVFALFAAFYYWIGKISGLQYPETLGQIHFWIFFLGVNITFFPMHFLGLAGMPRRIPDYPDAFAGWNGVASYGSYVSVVGAILFFYVVYKTLTGNEKCAPNPWQTPSQPAQTLEWVLPSPPSFHTFEEIPAIKETKQEKSRAPALLKGLTPSGGLPDDFFFLSGPFFFAKKELLSLVSGLFFSFFLYKKKKSKEGVSFYFFGFLLISF